MPIQFEQVTGEITPERGAGTDTQASPPAAQDEMHDKLIGEMALLHERRMRLFAD